MSKVDLDSLFDNLDSQHIEKPILMIEKATNIIESLAIKAVDSLQTSSNRFLVAERLSSFGSIIIPYLEELLQQSSDFEVQILASLVLLQLNSKTGLQILLNAIRDDEEYAVLASQHLAQANIKDAIEPICDRLRSSKLEEIDLIVSLLDSLYKLGTKLPQDLLLRFHSDNISWQIKTKLEEQYRSMSSLSPNRATTLKDAYRICTPKPLVREDIERYYVDLSAVRSTKTIQNITANLQMLDPGEYSTLLFTGHRGCGKSTELRRIQKRLESEYYIIYLEADVELDLNDAEYTDIYLLIIKKIADELYRVGAKFDRGLLNSFESWFKEITNETERSVELGVSVQTDVEARFQIPFISKLLAKLLAQIKGSQRQKQVIRQTLQKDIIPLLSDSENQTTIRKVVSSCE